MNQQNTNKNVNKTGSYDLFRLSKSKELVDICSNTLRSYNADGLPFYRVGKAVYVSYSELEKYIRGKSA